MKRQVKARPAAEASLWGIREGAPRARGLRGAGRVGWEAPRCRSRDDATGDPAPPCTRHLLELPTVRGGGPQRAGPQASFGYAGQRSHYFPCPPQLSHSPSMKARPGGSSACPAIPPTCGQGGDRS